MRTKKKVNVVWIFILGSFLSYFACACEMSKSDFICATRHAHLHWQIFTLYFDVRCESTKNSDNWMKCVKVRLGRFSMELFTFYLMWSFHFICKTMEFGNSTGKYLSMQWAYYIYHLNVRRLKIVRNHFLFQRSSYLFLEINCEVVK